MNQQASVASGTLSNYGPESDVRVVCGGASIKGRRPQQEDVIMLHANSFAGPVFSNGEAIAVQGPQSGVSLVGVYDGHGGKRCSRYAAQHIPENFHAALEELTSRADEDTSSRRGDDVYARAIRLAYILTHEDFARMARGDGDAVRPKTRQRFRDAIEKINAPLLAGGPLGGGLGFDTSFTAIRSRMLQKRMAMGARMWDDGSTALTCLIKGSTILVANAGDSRAVACLGGKTVPLSVDHKPNLPAERARVQAAGGTVTCLMGCYRVMGMLAMSRALGDVIIEQYLSQEPDVVDQTLSHRDFVVMASDGLWDVLSNQEVVQLVQTESSKVGWNPEHLTTVANKVCMEAFRRGSMDNISVMIVLALGDVKSHEVAQKGESLGRTRQRTFNSRYRGTLDSDSNTLTTLAPHAPNGHRSLAAPGAGFEKRRREQGTMMHPGKVGGMVMGSSADPRDRLGMSYSSMPHLAGGLKSGNGILPRSQMGGRLRPMHDRPLPPQPNANREHAGSFMLPATKRQTGFNLAGTLNNTILQEAGRSAGRHLRAINAAGRRHEAHRQSL